MADFMRFTVNGKTALYNLDKVTLIKHSGTVEGEAVIVFDDGNEVTLDMIFDDLAKELAK